MRKPDDIREEISTALAKLKTIRQDIQKKHREQAKLKESHVRLVENTVGRQRMPKSLEKQRNSLLTVTLEIEGLEGARVNLETKLTDLQIELTRAELYPRVKAYRQAEQQLVDKAEMVVQEIVGLNKQMQLCKESVEEFLEEAGNPLEILRSLVNDPALSGLSHRAFFVGEITEAGSEENAIFMKELVQVYREFLRKLPTQADIHDSWVMLSNYFDFITLASSELIPRTMNYSVSDQSPPPAQKSSQAIHIHPKNLAPTGAPG